MTTRALAIAALAATASACTKPNPEYCNDSNRQVCETGFVCDLDLNRCFPEPDASGDAMVDASGGACQGDQDCDNSSAPICDEGSQTCRGCATDSDCLRQGANTPACAVDGRCIECAVDEHCESMICDVTAEACVAESLVVYVDSDGTDAVSCGTRAQPCQTLTTALQRVTISRNTVRMAPGDYTDEPTPVALDAIDVVVHGPGADLSVLNGPGLDIRNSSKVEVRGLAINAPASGTGTRTGIAVSGSGTSLRVIASTIEADYRGIACTGGAIITVEDSRFENNGNDAIGAGLCSTTVLNSTFVGNYFGIQAYGTLVVEGSEFTAHTIFPIIIYEGAEATIRRTLIRGNTNGFRAQGGDFTIENSFIVNNGTGTPGVFASGSNSTGTIRFSTIAGNTAADTDAGGVDCQSLGATDNVIVGESSIVFGNSPATQINCSGLWTYSDIEGGRIGTGNMDMDPLFVEEIGDYHLQSGSPARDRADPTATISHDFDGDARATDGRADIGADEIVRQR